MEQSSSFTKDFKVKKIVVKKTTNNYERVIELHYGNLLYELLAQNTNFQPNEGPVLPGLDLYLTNIRLDEFNAAVKEYSRIIELPIKLKGNYGLFENKQLYLRDRGLLITNTKPFHQSWDFESKRHTYVFDDFEIVIDIGALNDLIITVTDNTTGDTVKY